MVSIFVKPNSVKDTNSEKLFYKIQPITELIDEKKIKTENGLK